MISEKPLVTNDSTNIADTYNWDTVFAINYNKINDAITTAWPKMDSAVTTFNQAADDAPGIVVKGSFNPWQICLGGDGKNVDLQCPLQAGSTYTGLDGKSVPLDGVVCYIEIALDWVPDPSQLSFSIQGNDLVQSIVDDLNNLKVDSSLSAQFTTNKITISDAATVTVKNQGIEWILTDGSSSYYLFFATDKGGEYTLYIYKYGAQWLNNLIAIGNDISASEPAVVVKNITGLPKLDEIGRSIVPELFTTWFEANLSKYNYVFNLLNLSTQISQSTPYKWIYPTDTLYAVTDMGTMDSSVFGVLTMVNNNAASSNHQVSPNAIPAGCDAGFLISGTQFVQNIMLPGACQVFDGIDPSNFSIGNDNLSVTNNTELTWGNFAVNDTPEYTFPGDFSTQLNNGTIPQALYVNGQAGVVTSGFLSTNATLKGKNGQWIINDGSDVWLLSQSGGSTNTLNVFEGATITIPANNFIMSLIDSQIEIQFIGLTYPYKDFNVSMNYIEFVSLGLQNLGGKQIFSFNEVSRSLQVTLAQTKSSLNDQLITSIVLGSLGVVLAVAGPAFEAFGSAAAAGAEASADGASTIVDVTAEDFATFAEDNVADVEQSEQTAAEDAESTSSSESASNSGRWSRFKAAFSQPKYKAMAAFGGVFGAVGGSLPTIVDNYLLAQATNKWDNVPGFDKFSNQLIAPYSWPGVTAFNLQSAQLNGSLQIGLTVSNS